MLKLWRYFKPYALQIIALFILIFITVDTSLQLPDYMGKIINEGIVNADNTLIWHNGQIMLLIALLGAAATIGVGYLASKIATGFSRDIRNEVFSRVESFSLTEFNKFSTASLITRSTNDIQQVQMVMVMLLRMIIQAPLTGGWAIYKAYHNAPSMSWVMALAVGILLSVIAIIFTFALPKFQLLQKLIDRLNLVTRENLTGLRVIRAFNNEKLEQDKFDKANLDLTATNLFVNRLMVIMQPMMMSIFNLTAVAAVWYGAQLIGDGKLLVGNMIAFMQYSMQVIMSFLMISIIFIMVPRASVSAKRVNEVLETEPSIKDPLEPKRAPAGKGRIEFRDVSYTYLGADTPVLDRVSFIAEPGQTTAIVGSTGSGKSTLLNLIPRFYDINSGEILIDDTEIRQYKLEDLYKKISYVPQKSVLFSGTVASNIKYGHPTATSEQVESAANIAQAKEFIDQTEGGYEASIAQGGANISGGQKQRLSIARAIARDPEIYLFDDSFSALDFKTDSLLRQALQSKVADKTVLIVAQRISTILNADKIIVLEDGKIVGQGSHKQLLDSCQVYREIAESQLSEDELRIQVPAFSGGAK